MEGQHFSKCPEHNRGHCKECNVNTMKGAIAVENATPTSASMVGARIDARSVEQACVSTTKSRSGAGFATLAKRKEQRFQQLSPIPTWKPTISAWNSQRG